MKKCSLYRGKIFLRKEGIKTGSQMILKFRIIIKKEFKKGEKSMRKLLLILLICILYSTVFAAPIVFYIESRTFGGDATDVSLYEESASGWGTSTAKSTASGLVGTGSRYTTNVYLDAYFIWHIGNHTSFVTGKSWDIYLTTPNSPSAIAEQSPYVLYDTAHPEGSPLDSGLVDMVGWTNGTFTNLMGGIWYLFKGNVALGAGAALKISEALPQTDRLDADAVMVVEHVSGPTPTATPTPTPWPTPIPMDGEPTYIADDVPEAEFGTIFTLFPTTTVPPTQYAWFYATPSGYNSDSWYRDNRVASTNPVDSTAYATWTIQGVPDATNYTAGYYVVDANYYTNCYYRIQCTATSVNEVVRVSQNYTGSVWCKMKDNLHLSGDVVITLYNIGRVYGAQGIQMRADAVGIFIYMPPILNAKRWELYE